jgi:hypothetical protein
MSLREGGRTFGVTTGNLKRLLVAADDYADQLPDVEAERTEIQLALSDADDAIRRQTHFLALRTQATKDVKAALARGREAGSRLQRIVTGRLGLKDERLTQFLVKPQRKRASGALKRAKQTTAELKERIAELTDGIEGDKAP